MKPIYENIDSLRNASVHAHKAVNKFLEIPWHYHPEIEITHIHNGVGKRFIGTSISAFKPGEVALIGPNIPHLWINDRSHYRKESELEHEDWVIQFKENFLGKDFLDLPEIKGVKKLLKRSYRGLIFNFDDHLLSEFLELFGELIVSDPFSRIPILLRMLGIMEKCNSWEYLNSESYTAANINDSERMQNIFNYVTDNFKKKICLDEAAEIISLSPSGFSRYFKRLNGKTFFEYVNEVRIEHACRNLMYDDLSITQICYECGFNNFSNFSRHFKKFTGYPPLKYRQMLRFEGRGQEQ